MTYHHLLSVAGGIFAMLMFVPMFLQILRQSGDGQSFASWLLWGVLDLILIISLLEQHGNFWFVIGFAIGDLAIAGLLASQRRFNWGRFETTILAMVIVCIIGWQTAGPRVATIFSIAGVCIAGVPGFLTLKRNPDRKTARVWLGFSFANLLSLLGADAMTLEQCLAPGVFTFASLLMVWAGYRPSSAT